MQTSQRRGLKKALSNRSARALTVVALLATLPAALYALGRSTLAVVAVVNVLLIFGSLYVLTAPSEDEGHESEGVEEHEPADAEPVGGESTDGETPESVVESEESAT